MRECKARLAVSRSKAHSALMVADGVQGLHDQGLLRKGKTISMRVNVKRAAGQEIALVVHDRSQGLPKNQRLTASTMLDIAACVASASEVARAFVIHQRSVRRIRALVAEVALSAQADTCKRLAAAMVHGAMVEPQGDPDGNAGARPLFCISSLAFDETAEKLSLDMVKVSDPTVAANIARSTWHVLVSRHSLSLGFQNNRRIVIAEVPLIRPTIPLVSTSAGAVYDGLFSATMIHPHKLVEEAAFKHVPRVVWHTDRDGAFANDKCLEARRRCLPEKVLASDMACGNHRNQLIEVAVTTFLGTNHISALYRLALFFRMGGNFMRLALAARKIFQEQPLRIVWHEPGPTPFNDELVDYFKANRQDRLQTNALLAAERVGMDNPLEVSPRQDDVSDDDEVRSGSKTAAPHKESSRWHASLQELQAIFNSDWSLPVLTHHCYTAECCNNYDRNRSTTRATQAIVNHVCRALPIVPTFGKWTKVGPCLDTVLSALLVHKLLPSLMQTAYQDMRTGLDLQHEEGSEAAELEETSWAQVAGLRCNITFMLLRQKRKLLFPARVWTTEAHNTLLSQARLA